MTSSGDLSRRHPRLRRGRRAAVRACSSPTWPTRSRCRTTRIARSASTGRRTAPRSPRPTATPRRPSPPTCCRTGRTTACSARSTALVGDADSPWRWIIDPIDGTSNFVRGIPVWATLVALTHVEHGAVVGVVSAPAMGRRWWAAQGLGAFADGRRVPGVDGRRIDEAQVSVTFSPGWDALGLTDKLVQLQQAGVPGPRLRRLLAAHARRRRRRRPRRSTPSGCSRTTSPR